MKPKLITIEQRPPFKSDHPPLNSDINYCIYIREQSYSEPEALIEENLTLNEVLAKIKKLFQTGEQQ